FGAPAEFFGGEGGAGVAAGDIARAAVGEDVGKFVAAGSLEGMQHIQHRVAVAGTRVECLDAQIAVQPFQGLHVPFRPVHDVDVIPHTGTVRCRVIGAEHVQVLAPAQGYRGDVGHEVVGDIRRVFADATAAVGPDRIEIAQQG